MFVPPYVVLNTALDQLADSAAGGRKGSEPNLQISRKSFEFMLRCLLAYADFDEAEYLAKNPDVADAVAKGGVRSGRYHYVMTGYLENRLGGAFGFDEKWYLEAYPDVAAAIRQKSVGSAWEHYSNTGIYEWRSPNAKVAAHVASWREAFQD